MIYRKVARVPIHRPLSYFLLNQLDIQRCKMTFKYISLFNNNDIKKSTFKL